MIGSLIVVESQRTEGFPAASCRNRRTWSPRIDRGGRGTCRTADPGVELGHERDRTDQVGLVDERRLDTSTIVGASCLAVTSGLQRIERESTKGPPASPQTRLSWRTPTTQRRRRAEQHRAEFLGELLAPRRVLSRPDVGGGAPATRNDPAAQTASRTSLSAIIALTVAEFITAAPADQQEDRQRQFGQAGHVSPSDSRPVVPAACRARPTGTGRWRPRPRPGRDDRTGLFGIVMPKTVVTGGTMLDVLACPGPARSHLRKSGICLSQLAARAARGRRSRGTERRREMAQPFVGALERERAHRGGIADWQLADQLAVLPRRPQEQRGDGGRGIVEVGGDGVGHAALAAVHRDGRGARRRRAGGRTTWSPVSRAVSVVMPVSVSVLCGTSWPRIRPPSRFAVATWM